MIISILFMFFLKENIIYFVAYVKNTSYKVCRHILLYS
jgi:hypothetical protein